MEMTFLAYLIRGLLFSKYPRVNAPGPSQESRKHFKQLRWFLGFICGDVHFPYNDLCSAFRQKWLTSLGTRCYSVESQLKKDHKI